MVIAVASKVGGDNPAEAYRIGQQYKGECSLPHIGEGGGGNHPSSGHIIVKEVAIFSSLLGD